MAMYKWDAEQAVTRGRLDDALEGCCSIDRYGVVPTEGSAREPLWVALAQEEAEAAPSYGADDQWVLVDPEVDGDDRLFDDTDERGPEELAMHLVTP